MNQLKTQTATSELNLLDSCEGCERFPVQPEDLVEIAPAGTMTSKLNWLRAGVLGANDGIVSTAGLVVGVAGATTDTKALLFSGIAGLVAGALSMAAGEYVSVSTQRDAERAAIDGHRREITEDPDAAQRQLAGIIAGRGVSRALAYLTARELSRDPKTALDAHVHYELNMDADELTSPIQAAFASMLSFALGAILPLLAILLTPTKWAVIVTAIVVTVALAITGSVSAKLGGAPILRATIRVVLWGNIAMIVTYWIGTLVGGFAA